MKLAFIGMGNMAYAILKGGCDRGFFNPAHVSAYDINTVRLAEVAAETGITAAVSAAELACTILPMPMDAIMQKNAYSSPAAGRCRRSSR